MQATATHRIKNALVTLLALLFASSAIVLIAHTGRSDAYEGTFCYEEYREEYEGCESVQRKEIRRAIGHTRDAYTGVAIETSTEATGAYCRTIECEASTDYLAKDGTGEGFIWNEGPNGRRRVYGYLYP